VIADPTPEKPPARRDHQPTPGPGGRYPPAGRSSTGRQFATVGWLTVWLAVVYLIVVAYGWL
jgi:hypothetical protein